MKNLSIREAFSTFKNQAKGFIPHDAPNSHYFIYFPSTPLINVSFKCQLKLEKVEDTPICTVIENVWAAIHSIKN